MRKTDAALLTTHAQHKLAKLRHLKLLGLILANASFFKHTIANLTKSKPTFVVVTLNLASLKFFYSSFVYRKTNTSTETKTRPEMNNNSSQNIQKRFVFKARKVIVSSHKQFCISQICNTLIKLNQTTTNNFREKVSETIHLS